jgi:hypothetical protein
VRRGFLSRNGESRVPSRRFGHSPSGGRSTRNGPVPVNEVLFTLSDRTYNHRLERAGLGKLSQAFGNAEDLPRVLAELSPEPKDPIWKDLWNRVYDQGDIFSASPNLLPGSYPGSYEVAKDSLAHNRIQAHAAGPRLRVVPRRQEPVRIEPWNNCQIYPQATHNNLIELTFMSSVCREHYVLEPLGCG